MITEKEIQALFTARFNRSVRIFRAPGRINLIGEHTDYNEGFVMPAAIGQHITFAMAANGTDITHCYAVDLDESASFSPDERKPGNQWVNYLMGVMQGLQQVGFVTGGVDCVFSSNIPTGAGLSSSAALCCGFGFAVSEVLNLGVSRLGLAKIAQFSEHHFMGVKCGIMDQYASLFGEEHAALLLDCRALEHEILPVHLGSYCIILVDSRVKHTLASTAYNDRRASCEEGVQLLAGKYPEVHSLRDVSQAQLNSHQDLLGEEVFMKCRFIVGEIDRTRRAAILLKEGNTESFGALLNETHWGLSKEYDVSCEELDTLVLLAEEKKSIVCGSRMMGGGFGGCTINLVRKDQTDHFAGFIHDKYFTTFKKEPEFYRVELSGGVHEVFLLT